MRLQRHAMISRNWNVFVGRERHFGDGCVVIMYPGRMTTRSFPSAHALCATLAMVALGTLLLTADRAEAQSLSLTGGMALLLGPPEAQGGQPVLGTPQDGQTAPPPDAQQPPQAVYIVETQAPPGYGQPVYGQPGVGGTGAMGPSAQASQEAQAESNGLIPRLIFEPVIAFGVGWSLGAIGMLIGMAAGDCFSLDSGFFNSTSCVVGIVAGAYIGLLLGIPLGVTWAGGWFGGMGSFGSAFLGTLAGVGVAVIISALVQDYGAIVGSALLPVAGAVIGYELSSSSNARAGLAGVALTPVFDGGRATGATAGVRFAF